MSISEVFSGNLCYPTNNFYNSSSISAQNMCVVPQSASVYNEESEFEIPTISTKGLEWKAPNVSESKNRARICKTIEKKDDDISVTICYPNHTVERILEAIKSVITELPQDFDDYLPTIIEKVNDLKSTMSDQMQTLVEKIKLNVKSLTSNLSQDTCYYVSKVKDCAVLIYKNIKSFVTNSVTSLKQKIN